MPNPDLISAEKTTPGTPDPLTGGDYAVVVAHPDDEVLWFSSVLAHAKRIIFCYGDFAPSPSMGPARRKVVDQVPYRNVVFLDLPEGEFHECGDWRNPRLVPAGIAIRDAKVRRRYEKNFELLVSRLEPLLGDVDSVFTHNPWGEYGHEDHVQVHRAITTIHSRRKSRKSQETRVLVPPCFTPKTLKMMKKTAACIGPQAFTRRVDKERVKSIKELYSSHGCWTYFEDWVPPDQESFLLLRNDRRP